MKEEVYVIIEHRGDEWSDYLSLVGIYTDKKKAKATFDSLYKRVTDDEKWYKFHKTKLNKLVSVYLGGYGE